MITNLRYDLRYFILYILTRKDGARFIWVTNKKDAVNYLQLSTTKGIIETKLSRKAWEPILSIESENTDTWWRLKSTLLSFMSHLRSKDILKQIIIANTSTLEGIITSREISILTIKCFMEYIFVEGNTILDTDVIELYEASLEFRKEIALKGKGDKDKKLRAVQIVSKYIKNDCIFRISVILQPFIISPAINISDIAIDYDVLKSVEHNICRHHPFPVIERVVHDCTFGKCYVFIPTDELCILPFGYGERQCTGKEIASVFVKTFFESLLLNPRVIFRPNIHHYYSGRHNDKNDNAEAILFQIRKVIDLLTT